MIKKISFIIFISFVLLCIDYSGLKGKKKDEFRRLKIKKFPFYLYSYKRHTSNYILSGYMGDIQDMRLFKVKEKYSKKRSIKMIYKPDFNLNRNGWAGLYWQYPANNWGYNLKGGYDLSNAKYMFFYARGSRGGESVEFKIGGIQGSDGDSDDITTGIVTLSKEWTLYKIDLRNRNLKNIIGGFGLLFLSRYNPNGVIFYLNDIYYTDKNEAEESFFKASSRKVLVEKSLSIEEVKNELLISISESEKDMFETDSDKIKKEGYKILNRVANLIKKESYRRIIITIRVYDIIGDYFNENLSRRRAIKVKNCLINKGVNSKKIGYKRYTMKPAVKKKKKKLSPKDKEFKILIIRWKKGEEENFKDYYFTGLDAYIREGYQIAIDAWRQALKIDPENDDIRRRMKESKVKLKEKRKKIQKTK